MKRWFCGFSSVTENAVATLPKPQKSEVLWEGANPFWLCGPWRKQQVITLFEGPVRVAIVGTCLEPYESLVQVFHSAINTHDYSRLMRLPGSYNVIVQEETDTYIFTDVAGLRPVFYTMYNSGVVYSSLGIPLQQLIKADVDLAWLSTFLVFLSRPHEAQNHSSFCHVYSVPPGHYLKITSGQPACKRYWQSPEYISFSEAAEQLRHQLLTSVEGRIRLYGNVTSDLSGGYDSTSLAMIAAKNLATKGQTLHSITYKSRAAIESDDAKWAEHAASLYPNIDAVMIEEHEIPTEYSDLESATLTDAPNSAINTIGKLNHSLEMIRSKGSQLHMSGEGGDAVLLAPDAYLIDVFKRGQLGTFLQHTYGRARLNLISPLTLIKSLIKLHRTSYRQWLHQQTQKLSDQSLRILPLMYQQLGVGYMMSWDFVPHIGKWYTDQLVDSVVSELEQWSTDANPFAESPWKNEFMAEIFLTGFATRTIQQMSDQFDVNLEFPYLDSLVIDTCLSARPEERTTPFTYKPLLTKALSNDIPSSIFIRMTKGDYTSDEFAGLKKNLSSMKTLLKNSLLADRGLIDLAEYHAGLERHMITGIDTNSSHLNQTLAVELWLRQLMNANDNFWMHEN